MFSFSIIKSCMIVELLYFRHNWDNTCLVLISEVLQYIMSVPIVILQKFLHHRGVLISEVLLIKIPHFVYMSLEFVCIMLMTRTLYIVICITNTPLMYMYINIQ